MSPATLALAEKIGEKEEIIQPRNVQWAAEVVKKGVIVEVHIGRIRFMRKMTKEDLGLDITDVDFQNFAAEYLDFGSKLLLPKRILHLFDKIEGRGRRNLERYSFQTPWGWFVPSTAYQKWKEENEKFKAEYLEQTRKLAEDIGMLKAEILNEYIAAAGKLYERTMKLRPLDAFIKEFLHNLESQIPTGTEILNAFYYKEEIFYIPLPSEVEEEFLRAETLRKDTAVIYAKTQAEIDKTRAEAEMHKDAVKVMLETKKQKVDSLLDTVSSDLRGAIYSTLKDALGSIKKKAVITSGSVKSLRCLIEKTRLMNFMGDEEIEAALVKIDEALQAKHRGSVQNTATIFKGIAAEFKTDAFADDDDLPNLDEAVGVLL